jgi:hypothetical protein
MNNKMNKMKTSFSRARFFPSLLFIVLLAPVPTLGQRLHPRFKEAKPGDAKPVISRVVILPAQVSLSKDGMKGNERLDKEAAAATPIIEKALAKALGNKNLTVIDGQFTPEALQNDEKLKYAVADLRRNYDDLHSKIIKKQKDVEKGRFSLGDQVLLLNQDDSIDAFVFVDAAGERKTGGKKALGIVTVTPWTMLSSYAITIGIVDARSGDVLAYTLTTTGSDIGKADDRKLVEVITKSLKKFPSRTPTEKKLPAGTTAEKK